MIKLLKADFRRILRSAVLRTAIVLMSVLGIYKGFNISENLKLTTNMFYYLIPLLILITALCPLFVGNDYSDGTIRNKLTVGHSRSSVYFSNLIVNTAAGLIISLCYLVPFYIIGIIRHGVPDMKNALPLLLSAFLLTLAFAAINTLISMLLCNKAGAVVACMACLLVSFCVVAFFEVSLIQTPYITDYAYNDSGELINNGEVPNPRYASELKRDIYQKAVEAIPSGQALLLTLGSVSHMWKMPIYSLILSVVLTAVGLWLFRRKNIN